MHPLQPQGHTSFQDVELLQCPCLRDQWCPSVALHVVPMPGHHSCGFSHHNSPCSPGEGAHLGTLKASAIAKEAGGHGRCLP